METLKQPIKRYSAMVREKDNRIVYEEIYASSITEARGKASSFAKERGYTLLSVKRFNTLHF